MRKNTEKGAPRVGLPAMGRRLKIKHFAVASLEAEMLRRVRAGEGVSRVDLARQLGLAPSTVGTYVDRLIHREFLSEGRRVERDFGRPPSPLSLNPAGGRFIGVDFNAQNILGTEVDFSQQPLRQIHRAIDPTDSIEQILEKIEGVIDELMKSDARAVLGIGVGVPGTIDPRARVALRYDHIRGWENIPLGRRLAERFKTEVHLENNIRTMALAELWFGQGRGLEHFVCLGIRTGISAGIISRGRLLLGHNRLAGGIRDWLCPVAPMPEPAHDGQTGRQLVCNRQQRLEEIVSMPSILKAVQLVKNGRRNASGKSGPIETFEEIAREVELGDRVVIGVLHEVARTLGWVACQIHLLLNPQKIIIAGTLVELGGAFLNPLESAVGGLCAELRQKPPVIVGSQLGKFNGALGAAALAFHEWKPAKAG